MPQTIQDDEEAVRLLEERLSPDDDIILQKKIDKIKTRKGREPIELTEEDEKILDRVWSNEAKRIEKLKTKHGKAT